MIDIIQNIIRKIPPDKLILAEKTLVSWTSVILTSATAAAIVWLTDTAPLGAVKKKILKMKTK